MERLKSLLREGATLADVALSIRVEMPSGPAAFGHSKEFVQYHWNTVVCQHKFRWSHWDYIRWCKDSSRGVEALTEKSVQNIGFLRIRGTVALEPPYLIVGMVVGEFLIVWSKHQKRFGSVEDASDRRMKYESLKILRSFMIWFQSTLYLLQLRQQPDTLALR